MAARGDDGTGAGDPLMYRYPQAAKKLGISVSQLYRLMAEGQIAPLRLSPKVCRITAAELDAFVEKKIAERDGGRPAA